MSASIDTILTAETPEGIAIVIRPAGFAVRCTAFLIDIFIRFFILSSLGTALGVAGHFTRGAMFIILFVVNWLYPVIFELTPLADILSGRVER